MNQKVDGERMKKGYKEKRFAIGVIYSPSVLPA